MYLASQQGHIDCVRKLVENGSDIESVNNLGASACFVAAQNGRLDCLEYLLDHGANIENTTDNGASILYIAAECGQFMCVFHLIHRGANLNCINTSGHSVLHIASQNNYCEIVKLLLDSGANIECTTHQNATSLFIATYEGHLQCMKILLDAGANIESRTYQNVTPLFIAVERGYIECVVLLLDNGANMNIKRDDDVTILHMAAEHKQILRLLLDKGVNIENEIVDIQIDESKQMILEEIEHRAKRKIFDTFVNLHIEYVFYKSNIYHICYPRDLVVAAPQVGWLKAQKVVNKYFFDEILFYIELNVARTIGKRNGVASYTSLIPFLAKNNDTTWTLLKIFSDYLKQYLQLIL